jgi:hypothetical protein
MTQEPPGAVPPEVFCVAGWTLTPVLDHEEFLLQQHEAGAVRLFDRGQVAGDGPPLRRWRLSWQRGGPTVHAVLAMMDLPDSVECIKVWVAAHCDAGWGWDVPSPLNRLGLNHHLVVDPLNGLAATGSTSFTSGDAVDQVLSVVRDRRTHVPVLVHHVGPEGMAPGVSPFRYATFGAVGIVFLDDHAASAVSAELPVQDRVPEQGARLYFPPWWADRLDDVSLARDQIEDEQRWRDLVDVALRASRWRARGPMAVDDGLWRALSAGEWSDERVAEASGGGSARWFTFAEGLDKSELRHRIQSMGDNAAELRNVVSDQESAVARLEDQISRNEQRVEALTRSRRVLARGALRLRGERDAARGALERTSVGAALRVGREARNAASRLSSDLQEVEDEVDRLRRKEKWLLNRFGRDVDVPEPDSFSGLPELLASARELTGIRLGSGVSDQVELGGSRLRRCWDVLDLLDDFVVERPGRSAEEHVRGGFPRALLISGLSGAAVTFPVAEALDPSGWLPFPTAVRLDHSTEPPCAVHYFDDTGGPTGIIHIGYIGWVRP